jgi:hypothetical protein
MLPSIAIQVVALVLFVFAQARVVPTHLMLCLRTKTNATQKRAHVDDVISELKKQKTTEDSSFRWHMLADLPQISDPHKFTR